MGLIRPPPQRRGADHDSGPIGAWKRRHAISVSTIRFDEEANAFIYGKEIDADLALVTHDLRRRSSGRPRKVAFTRLEIRVAARASEDIKGGGKLFLSEMPVGQRRVHEALIQTYPSRAPAPYFEDFDDLPEDLADPVSREALSDDEAIAVLHRMRVNTFESGKTLVGGFLSNAAGAFASYDDESADEAPKRREANLRLADATYSIGAVREPDAVRHELWLDRGLSRAFELAERGRLRVKASATGPDVMISPEVSGRATEHLDIAIRQAMAGAGEKAAGLVGQPVATYAKWLFERHLFTAQERFSGRIPPLQAFDPNVLDRLSDDIQSDGTL
jgi:hypothetical protein